MSLLEQLAAQHCRPRRGEQDRLTRERIDAALSVLSGWSLANNGQAIIKEFRFADYYRTLAFVNAVAYIAHAEDHHPDLEVGYNRCRVLYSTHDAGGLSENDLICAAQVEKLLPKS